ncbi:hypothetical protein [Mycobacteroides franklinii]|uniref:hypothetical protein n=1 Tax=Mycobacteroides franklinii TaxID=948102 RepID=UPI000994815E|nr:hypothetical protein [Mycobacteroides franklinii]
MTTISARKGKVRADEVLIDSSEALGLTAQSYIVSPRYVAQGRDAWEGTLGELLGDHLEGSDRERLWRLEENLIDRGVITEDEDGNQGFEIADVAHLLTYDDISDLLDDPNVVISVEGHRP